MARPRLGEQLASKQIKVRLPLEDCEIFAQAIRERKLGTVSVVLREMIYAFSGIPTDGNGKKKAQ